MTNKIDIRELPIDPHLVSYLSAAINEERVKHLLNCCAAAIQHGVASEALEFRNPVRGTCVVVAIPAGLWATIVEVMDQRQKLVGND